MMIVFPLVIKLWDEFVCECPTEGNRHQQQYMYDLPNLALVSDWLCAVHTWYM